jgi:hypothetical protein
MACFEMLISIKNVIERAMIERATLTLTQLPWRFTTLDPN